MVSLIAVARGRWRRVGRDVYSHCHCIGSRSYGGGGLFSMLVRSLRSFVRIVTVSGLVNLTAVPNF